MRQRPGELHDILPPGPNSCADQGTDGIDRQQEEQKHPELRGLRIEGRQDQIEIERAENQRDDQADDDRFRRPASGGIFRF